MIDRIPLPATVPLLLAVLACKADGPATTPLPAGSASYSGALGPGPDFEAPAGRLSARAFPSEVGGGAELTGAFADGPPLSFHTESAREGSCRIISFTATSCDPACPGDQACIAGGCVAYPARTDLGAVEWTYTGGTRTVTPDGTLAYYASATDAAEGPMSLEVGGVLLESPTAPLMVPDGDWSAALSGRGSGDAVLGWTNPMDGARVRLHMTDCTGSHGGLAANELECEGPDTGELVIPAAFMDLMEEADWSRGECGSHVFHRYHAAALPDDDQVRFEVRSGDGLFWRPDF
ncbi:MAG: hypothetical protein R3F61_23355 [Myxococcota bacterium]